MNDKIYEYRTDWNEYVKRMKESKYLKLALTKKNHEK